MGVCVGREEYEDGFEILFDSFNELMDIYPLKLRKPSVLFFYV